MSDTTMTPQKTRVDPYEHERSRQKMGIWISDFWRLAGEEETRAAFEETIERLRNMQKESPRGV